MKITTVSQKFFVKKLFLLVLCLIALNAGAQNIVISGIVKNEAGQLLPQAMVEVLNTAIILKVDSAAEFSFGAAPKSKLLVSCPGYDEKQVNLKSNNKLTVVLSAKNGAEVSQSQNGSGSTNRFANDLTERQGAASNVVYGSTGGSTGALLPVFAHTEATHGSRYLYEGWLNGAAVGTNSSVYSSPTYTFAYDKISGNLLLSQDKEHAIEVAGTQLKSFTLDMPDGDPETFIYAPDVDASHFVQLLSDGKNYQLLKHLNTKFIKNNYKTDGMTSSGNNYDEYADEPVYYSLDKKTNNATVIPLKKKQLKAAFPENPALDEYLKEHSGTINDEYLTNLIIFLNK